jgi:hypothetical protein
MPPKVVKKKNAAGVESSGGKKKSAAGPSGGDKVSLTDQKKAMKLKEQKAKDKDKNEKEKERNERKTLESRDKVFGLKNLHTSSKVAGDVEDLERNKRVVPGEQQKAEAIAREKAKTAAANALAEKELAEIMGPALERRTDITSQLRDVKLDPNLYTKSGAKSKALLAMEAKQLEQEQKAAAAAEAAAAAAAAAEEEGEQDPFAVDDDDVDLDEMMAAVKR